MIGRGAYGRPWLLGAGDALAAAPASGCPIRRIDEQYAMIAEQYDAMLDALWHEIGVKWPASISAGTPRGCTARPSSATPSTSSPIPARAKAMLREFYAPWLLEGGRLSAESLQLAANQGC